LIYYAKKDNDKALIFFDKLIKRDRKSAEANEALNTVKAIYTAKGDPMELENILKSYGAFIPQGELDSLTYNNGKNHYMDQDCKSVVSDFEKYILKFPDGIFITQANFYKAECDYKLGNTDEAVKGYSFVISRPKNEFTEQSLYKASDIAFKKQDYPKAIEIYKLLEVQAENLKNSNTAIIGLLRSYYNTKSSEEIIVYANKVLKIENVDAQLINEAHYDIAQTYLSMQKLDEAQAEFQSVANSSKAEIGTESKYNVATIFYQKQDFKQSKKLVFELINGDGDYPFWVTKAMILLADNYVALKDNFQAKGMLKGIIDESDIPELIKIAQEKLDKITADEEAAKQIKAVEEPIKVEFEGNSPQQNKLFTDPATTTPPVNEGEPKHE
jgi:TolA-binding protein